MFLLRLINRTQAFDTAVLCACFTAATISMIFGQAPPPAIQETAQPAIQETAVAQPQPEKLAQEFEIKRVLVPFDIAKIALANAQSLASFDLPFMRYVYLNGEVPTDDARAVNIAVNHALSRAGIIIYPYVVHPRVLRYDLRTLAPKAADLEDLIETYEEGFSFDPYFHEFLEEGDDFDEALEQAIEAFRLFLAFFDNSAAKSSLSTWKKFLQVAKLQQQLSLRRRQFDVDFLRSVSTQIDKHLKSQAGKNEQQGFRGFGDALRNLQKSIDRLADEADAADDVETRSRRSGAGAVGLNSEVVIPARHVGQAAEVLAAATQTDAAITRADFFIHIGLSSIDIGHGGGRYYDFSGIESEVAGVTLRQRKSNGQTDFEAYLAGFGVDLEVINDLRSDQAAAIFASRVTGRCRKVILVPQLGVRPTAGAGLIVYTQDPSDDQVAAADDPTRNLINFNFAAAEVIAELPNGCLQFSLFNAAGALQLSAPDNVVADHSIPAPYTRRLHSFSCFACHGPQRGRMPFDNDIQKLTRSGVDILDDLSSGDGLDDLIDRLVGQYQGDFTKPLDRSRNDLEEAVYRSTAFVRGKGWGVVRGYGELKRNYHGYAYRTVTPKIALAELGYIIENEYAAQRFFGTIVPRLPPIGGVYLADPALSALRAGIPVKRPAWEGVYFDAALRAIITAPGVKKLQKIKVPKEMIQ